METNNFMLVDDRHLITEWAKSEPVRGFILLD